MESNVPEVIENLKTSLRLREDSDRSLLIYIHIPFCNYRCQFCDWVNNIPAKELITTPEIHRSYAKALCRQIREVLPRVLELGYKPKYVYWGGGTPTILPSECYEEIAEALFEVFDISQIVEYSMEATPETINEERISLFKKIGVNRLSLGAQMLDDESLKKFGRNHTVKDLEMAAKTLNEMEFYNFNIDMMVGLPNQQLDGIEEVMNSIISYNPGHVTLYSYRPSKDTVLANRLNKKGIRLSADTLIEMQKRAIAMLQEVGFREYILGYFARGTEFKFKAEDYYFGLGGDYLGLGSGAGSHLANHNLVFPSGNIQSFVRDPLTFERCKRYVASDLLPVLSVLRQAIMTENGIEFEKFNKYFGFDFKEIANNPVLKSYMNFMKVCGAEFIERDDCIKLNPDSRLKANILTYVNSIEYKGYYQENESDLIDTAEL